MNLQVIASPDGDIVWVSGALPGAVHDLTAARIWGIIRELAASGLVVLGDKGYLGEDDIRTPYRGRGKPASQKEATGLMPGSAPPANEPMPSSSPGASCVSFAAARGAPGNWPRPSTSFRPAKSEDEKGSLFRGRLPQRRVTFSGTSPTRSRSGPSAAPTARWCRMRWPPTWTAPNPDTGRSIRIPTPSESPAEVFLGSPLSSSRSPHRYVRSLPEWCNDGLMADLYHDRWITCTDTALNFRDLCLLVSGSLAPGDELATG